MTVFSVSNATQLQTALGSAVGGDKIVLNSGDYGAVTITNRNYASNVTIQTASFTDRAHFDGLFVSKSSNLTFTGLDVGRALKATETPEWTQLNWVRDSSNIRMNGVQFHGSEDGNPQNDGIGLVATGVKNLMIDYSSFNDLFRGACVQQSSNVTIRSNDFETIRSDGLCMAADTGVLITDNSFTDFHPVLGDHADGIQFWNTGQTSGSSNVVIRNNVIAPGRFSGVEGEGVQGIWISDPGAYGFKNFTIENNLIYTHGAWNGIGVRGATNFQIVGNTLLSQEGDNKSVWIRAEDSNTVVLKDNFVEDIMLKSVTGLTQTHNVDLSVNPELRSLVPNLEAPSTLQDLIVADYGYQAPANKLAAVATVQTEALHFYTPFVVSQYDHFTALP